ncbi:MAG: SDR family NAD(P)-dependent oxidoreductase [Alsobacter sp.]
MFAVISGGSSGIGFACAAWLIRQNIPVILLARDGARLAIAASRLSAWSPQTAVRTRQLDVRDPCACADLASELKDRGISPSWVVAAAGIARPGRFLEQDPRDHRDQMDVNYFGTLNLVHALAPAMTGPNSHVVMIASGAALMGIPGYTAYSPSKFAVRGLAECLRVELASRGVAVTLAYPPDTLTPQLDQERAFRPPETAAIAAGGGVACPERVANDIMRAASAGRFAVTTGRSMYALLMLHSLIGPLLRFRHLTIARRFLERPAADHALQPGLG